MRDQLQYSSPLMPMNDKLADKKASFVREKTNLLRTVNDDRLGSGSAGGKPCVKKRAPVGGFLRQYRKFEEWKRSMLTSTPQRVAAMIDVEDLDVSPLFDVGEIADD